jgi:thiol-disulfide isomerase/thioredoxin
MKHHPLLVLLLTCVLCRQASTAQPSIRITDHGRPFQINGAISGRDTGNLILQYTDARDRWIKDTVLVTQGRLSFRGFIEGPVTAYLIGNIKSSSMEDPNRKLIFLEPGALTINLHEGDFQHAVISGSRAQDDIEALDRMLQPSRDSVSVLKAIGNRTPVQDSLLNTLYERLNTVKNTFIAGHPDSYVSPYLLSWFHNLGLSLDSAKRLFSRLLPEIQKSYYGRLVKQQFINEEASAPHHPAKDFSRIDLRGRTIRQADFKGKSCVLLDFWGSWCAPCRKLSPHIRQLYARYHKNGLQVISISNDTDPAAWKKAVVTDSIGVWINIGTDKNSSPTLARIQELYSVNAYPTLILIDRKGFIVNRFEGFGDSVDDLEQAIRQVL